MTPDAFEYGAINARISQISIERFTTQNRYFALAKEYAPHARPEWVQRDLDALSATLREISRECSDLEDRRDELAATPKLLPGLEPTKRNAMKRINAACTICDIAGKMWAWGAPVECDTMQKAIGYYMAPHIIQGPTEAHLAAEDFIIARVPGGANANPRNMTREALRLVFGNIALQAQRHEKAYRKDFDKAGS